MNLTVSRVNGVLAHNKSLKYIVTYAFTYWLESLQMLLIDTSEHFVSKGSTEISESLLFTYIPYLLTEVH